MNSDEIIDRLETDGILFRVPEFDWSPGIPSRNRITFATLGTVSVKVSHLTALRLVLIEETGADRMPVRTLARLDLGPISTDDTTSGLDADVARVEQVLRDLGIRP